MEEKQGSKRKIHIDILKIIAMALVFYVHTGEKAMHHYSIAGKSGSYWISMVMFIIAIAGPTVFFFISGGLLLGKEESLKDVLLKRVLRYAVLLVIFKIVQIIYLVNTNPLYVEVYQTNPVSTALKVLYSDKVLDQYWFLHSYLAFLLILPFLRAMVQKLRDKSLIYMICLYLIINEVLVIVEYYWDCPRIGLDMPFFETAIIAPCIGYCFAERFKDITQNIKFMIPINLIGLFFVGYDIYLTHISYSKTQNIVSADALGGTSIVIAILLFLNIKAVCDLRKKDYPKWIIILLGICASGSIITFLLDPQIHDWSVAVYNLINSKTNWILAVVCWTICALAIGIAIAFVLRSIPFVGILFGAKRKKKENKQ